MKRAICAEGEAGGEQCAANGEIESHAEGLVVTGRCGVNGADPWLVCRWRVGQADLQALVEVECCRNPKQHGEGNWSHMVRAIEPEAAGNWATG